MRIERVDLKAFGRFTDTSLDLSAGPNRFHLIYGPNESGKSTSLRAILAWLFGVPPRSTDNYLHSYPNLRVGGRLAADGGGVLECVRRKGKAKTLLTIDEGDAIDPAALSTMLGGMDEETFVRGFGLDRDRLVEGGRAIVEGQGDMGEILFAAGVGVSRLRELQNGLERECRDLFLPGGSKPALNQTLAELNALRNEMRAATLPTTEYKRRRKALETARGELMELSEKLISTRQQITAAERVLEAVPLVHVRQSLQKALAPLADVPVLDDAFVSRRREAEADLRLARVEHDQFRTRGENLNQRLKSLPSDDALPPYTPRIETLARQMGAREEAREHLRGLEKRRDQATSDIAELLGRLGHSADVAPDSLRIPDALRDRIWRSIDDGVRLNQQVESAVERLEERRRDLQQAEQQWQAMPAPGDPLPLESVLRRIANPQRFAEDLRKAAETAASQSARADAAVRRLSGFSGSRAEAVALRPPAAAGIERAARALTQAEDELEKLRGEGELLERNRSRITAELEGLRGEHAIPSEAELAAARTLRDLQLDSLGAATEDPVTSRDALRTAILAADRMVDRMRQEADRVAQRARAESQLASVEHETSDHLQRLSQLTETRDSAWSEWRKLWDAAGVDAGWPDEMRNWLDAHQAAVEASQEADTATRRLETLAAECQTLTQSLVDALREAGTREELSFDVSSAAGHAAEAAHQLANLYEVAERKRDQLSKCGESYEAAEKDVSRLRAETQRIESELATAEKRLAEWRTAWASSVQQIGAAADATPDEVRHRVDRIDQILEKKRERDQHQQRIDGIARDSELFAAQVTALVADTSSILVDPELNEMSPTQAIDRLHRRLQQFQSAARERNTLEEQWDENERQLQQAERAILRHEAVLQELCREVGCKTADQLPDIERRSAERRRIETELRQTEAQLERLAAGRPLDALTAECIDCEPERLTAELEQLKLTERTLDERSGELREQVGALRRDVEAMDGSSQAAELEQRIQDLTARASRQARSYAQLRVASVALGRAIEHYRQKNQGPILSRAETIFSRLTCGDYHALRPQFDDKGTPILVGIRGANDTAVPANCLSEGTADALFLALRLASLEAHVERRGPFPLIVDDILVQFDDARSAAALGVLAELARKTQVIFFTHHQHLIDLAESQLKPDEYHVHRLDHAG